MEAQLVVVMVRQTVVQVIRTLPQEEVTVTHHGMEVQQVVNIAEVTHAPLVETPIVQVPQMIHTTLAHEET